MESFKEKALRMRVRADEKGGGAERGERWERAKKREREKSAAISVELLNKFL